MEGTEYSIWYQSETILAGSSLYMSPDVCVSLQFVYTQEVLPCSIIDLSYPALLLLPGALHPLIRGSPTAATIKVDGKPNIKWLQNVSS